MSNCCGERKVKMRKSDYDEDDPDKHLKRLQRVIGVSARIVNLAVTRMSMSENKTETKAQKKERILVII